MFEDRHAIPSKSAPVLQPEDTARRSLDYIRDTLERSASFTAVPGWGNVGIGIIGLVAAWVGSVQQSQTDWLIVWIGAAAVSLVLGAVTVQMKARRIGTPLLGGAGRKFVFGLLPAFFSGAVLTAVLSSKGLVDLLPGVWLLLYGAAIVTAGMNSIALIRYLGFAFTLLGTIAFFTPPEYANVLLGIGFGFGHLGTGLVIVKRFGG